MVSELEGGFEVERLRLHSAFPARTFAVTAPPGAFDYQARLRAAAARVPPFRAVVSSPSNGQTYVDRVSWLNNQTWRTDVLSGSDPSLPGGAGSFVVSAGGSPQSYNAHENSYSSSTISSAANPILELLPEEDQAYSTAACTIVGHDRIAGRDAVRRHCSSYDVWVDGSTGILLRKESPAYEFSVRSIDYRPTFPTGTFRFAAPPGARSTDQHANDPYYKTRLAPGQEAPNWSATTLGGGRFSVAGLRGKPTLLLVFSDTCPPGDPACDVFAPLKQVYEDVKGRVGVVWVDLQGSADQARKVVGHNHLTFPVVVDAPGASIKAWKIQGYPYWLLLDSHGRVIEARLKPQTTAELRQLVAKAK